jgi:hypothetical protein
LPSTSFAPIATTSAFDDGARGDEPSHRFCELWIYQGVKINCG